jgi:hypothetical protein
MAEELGVAVEAAASIAAAVREAGVVLAATWAREPFIVPGMLGPGAHVTTLGPDEPGKAEVAADVILGALFVCDDRALAVEMAPDTVIVPVSRTIAVDGLVDEIVIRFTHTIEMDWMLPGISPTGGRVEVPMVVLVHFRDGKLAHEHIYWDQASVLVQIGVLDPSGLPVAGAQTARKVLDPRLPSNELMRRR